MTPNEAAAKDLIKEIAAKYVIGKLEPNDVRLHWLNLAEVISRFHSEIAGLRNEVVGLEEELADVQRERADLEGQYAVLRVTIEQTRAALGIGEHADLAEEAKRLSASIDHWRAEQARSGEVVADLWQALQKRTTELQIAVEERDAARRESTARHNGLLAIANELGISYEDIFVILDNLIEIRDLASPNPGESVLAALRRQLVQARAEIGDKQ